jgi:integrase
VEDYWKSTLVRDINNGRVRQGAMALYPTQSNATRNRQFIVPTMAIINHAASMDLCLHLRVKRLPEIRKEKPFATWRWIQSFMAVANPHLGALACFMFLTATRVSDALMIRWDDVDLESGRAIIRQGKLGGDERLAHLPPELVVALTNIHSDREPGTAVFIYSTRHTARKQWDAAVKRAKISHLTFHTCRHGFATGMMHAGVDPITVAKLGGWKDARHVFATYGHALADDTLANRLTIEATARED